MEFQSLLWVGYATALWRGGHPGAERQVWTFLYPDRL